MLTTSRRMLSRALHAASGIVIAVVGVEWMPEALGEAPPPWAIFVGLSLGGLLYIVLQWIVERMQGGEEGATGAWMVYIAVAIDLFSDGLMIGVGSFVSLALASSWPLGRSWRRSRRLRHHRQFQGQGRAARASAASLCFIRDSLPGGREPRLLAAPAGRTRL